MATPLAERRQRPGRAVSCVFGVLELGGSGRSLLPEARRRGQRGSGARSGSGGRESRSGSPPCRRAADVGELVAGEEALQTEPGAMGAQGALGAAPAKRETCKRRSYSSSIFNQSATCGEIV